MDNDEIIETATDDLIYYIHEEDKDEIINILNYLSDRDIYLDDIDIEYLYNELPYSLFNDLLIIMIRRKDFSTYSYNTVLFLISKNVNEEIIFNLIRNILIHSNKDYAYEFIQEISNNEDIIRLFDEERMNRIVPHIGDYELLGMITDMLRFTKYGSGRIKETIMKFPCDIFKKCRGKVIEYDNILVSEKYMNITVLDANMVLPVIRYESRGLGIYTQNIHSNKKYCGTFYYFEPESEYMLKSNKTLVAVNKLFAYHYLMTNNKSMSQSELYKYIYDFDMIDIKYGKLEDIEYEDYFIHVRNNHKLMSKLHILERMIQRDYDFNKSEKSLYASEDEIDQPLCKLAREEGYDTVVLMRMQGKKRIVSEVLDVRERNISYNNICCRE